MSDQPLRILQINTMDNQGGAARIAWNLFTAYRARGHSSWLAVGRKSSNDRDVLVIPNGSGSNERATTTRSVLRGIGSIVSECSRRLDSHLGIEDFHFPGTSSVLALTDKPPDILHAH